MALVAACNNNNNSKCHAVRSDSSPSSQTGSNNLNKKSQKLGAHDVKVSLANSRLAKSALVSRTFSKQNPSKVKHEKRLLLYCQWAKARRALLRFCVSDFLTWVSHLYVRHTTENNTAYDYFLTLFWSTRTTLYADSLNNGYNSFRTLYHHTYILHQQISSFKVITLSRYQVIQKIKTLWTISRLMLYIDANDVRITKPWHV